ncbi:HAMP domain-containing protein [Lachnospiraceae bacterium WCA-9-b2]|uniref:HAMP domain-containing protein n=1 Tax=Sporofaciens musculi TaxID=2681861 RepID=A0A7X3MKF5_9FIRM|nr:methyl-accepting chemotaxis protein [Sporofaciens musculi]MXP77915.1 HAMP domain-containing protein [Sporofaciens musculi]
MKKAMKQSKLITILNGLSIFALILMAILLLIYANANNQLSAANKVRYDLTSNANRFMDGSTYLTEEVRAYAATGDKSHYDNFQNEVNNLKNREAGVAAMQEIGITAEEQGMIDKMSSLSNDLVPLEENAMKNVQEGNLKAALDYVYGDEYNTTILQVNELKEEFLSVLETRTLKQIQTLNTRSMIIRIFLFAALVLVIIIQMIIMSVTRRRILKPIIAVRDQMGEISRGNLSAEFLLEPDTSEIGMLVDSIHETKSVLKQYIHDIDSKLAQMAQGSMNLSIDTDYIGEFLPIQNALRQILDSLNHALSQINQTARLVSDESEQVASDSRILSDGAIDQASAIEELSASIQSLSGQVNSTSLDADEARKISVDSATQLNACSKQMDKLTSAMEKISESSQQINGIIKTIEDISFQTNILALNASIEAARAGVSGKGFAVVADEVQSLANKSADAAQDITKLIEHSIELVKYGTSLSDETTEALSVGVSGAQSTADLIQKIADSAQQQALSLEQLTAGVEQISVVIQTNTNTAEKSASSANELYRQAGELKQSVQRFKLR